MRPIFASPLWISTLVVPTALSPKKRQVMDGSPVITIQLNLPRNALLSNEYTKTNRKGLFKLSAGAEFLDSGTAGSHDEAGQAVKANADTQNLT